MPRPLVRMDSYLDEIHRPGAEVRRIRFDAYRRTMLLTGITDELRMDANETALFAKQLEEYDVQIYDVEYPEFKGTKLVPVKATHEGADYYAYRSRDQVGVATLITNYSTDLPTVNMFGKEEKLPIKSFGAAYIYSVQDLRAAQMAGWQMETDFGEVAKKVIAAKIDDTIWFGNSQVGITGLANNPEVLLVTPVNGSWGTQADPTKTLDDLLQLEQDAYNASSGVEMPDTILIPQVRYAYLASHPLSKTNPDVTILDYFLKKSQFVKSVEADWRLNLANVAGTGPRAICYKRDRSKLEAIVPFEFKQMAPQLQNLAFKIPCEGRCGGVAIKYPGSVKYMDGI